MGQWTWGTIVDAPSAGINSASDKVLRKIAELFILGKFLCFVEPKSVPVLLDHENIEAAELQNIQHFGGGPLVCFA
jgi:hypothetical protein